MPRQYPTPEEQMIISTMFSDKSESWLATRQFIHSEPLKALDVLGALASKDPKFLDILHDFDLWARPEQFMDWGDWDTVMLLCGRGFGKSWFASNYIIDQAKKSKIRIALWASDLKSAKRVNWLGSSGIIQNMHPNDLRDSDFNKTDLTLTFPNGSTVVTYTAESFERSRGDSVHMCVLDELAAWSYGPQALEAARLIMRLGEKPKMLITTTPRSLAMIKEIAIDSDVKLIKGVTTDNYYLPQSYAETLQKKLTERMWRQEGLAEILDDNLYAMFQMSDIMNNRITGDFDFSTLKKLVIAIDPAVTSNENSDLTGIMVCGMGYDGKYYVIEDSSMEMASPEKWSSRVVSLYRKYNQHECPVAIVAEKNQGGDLITSVIRNAARNIRDMILPPVTLVHASRGKEVRAEPTSALYEQQQVCHVGAFEDLELQMTEWNPTDKNTKSPDRLDALVWAITSLSKGMSGTITSGYGGYNEPGMDRTAINPYCGYK